MIDVAGGWALGVERGPGWLFVKLNAAPQGWWQEPPLAETLWSLLQQHFTYRVVLECGEIPQFDREQLAQLVQLRHKIDDHGGVMRVCGLSPLNQEMIERCGFADELPYYTSRADAVMAQRPLQPR